YRRTIGSTTKIVEQLAQQ
ncbi:unnamed protein product, partial [Rotaria magnacalcarata]